jgi:hypothetical protein
MNTSTENTTLNESPTTHTSEHVAQLSKRNEHLADLEVSRMVEGMNRLSDEKKAAAAKP